MDSCVNMGGGWGGVMWGVGCREEENQSMCIDIGEPRDRNRMEGAMQSSGKKFSRSLF